MAPDNGDNHDHDCDDDDKFPMSFPFCAKCEDRIFLFKEKQLDALIDVLQCRRWGGLLVMDDGDGDGSTDDAETIAFLEKENLIVSSEVDLDLLLVFPTTPHLKHYERTGMYCWCKHRSYLHG